MAFTMKLDRAAYRAAWRAALALPLLTLSVACRQTSAPMRGVFATIVYGTVTTGGQARPNIRIEYEVYRESCGSATLLTASDNWTLSDQSGRFRLQILSADTISPQCVRLFVRDTNGTRIEGADVTALRYKLVSDASLPYDSVRVDIALP